MLLSRFPEEPVGEADRRLEGEPGLSTGLVAATLVDRQAVRMGWVYLLRCADDSFYVGSARDLDERLDQHSRAQIGYTSTRRPVALEWCAEAEIPIAYEMERRIHGWSRRKKQALIDGDIELLKLYAKRPKRQSAAESEDEADGGPSRR